MKISEIITDKYKLRIPPTVYYDLLADVVEAEEQQEPKKGHWISVSEKLPEKSVWVLVYCKTKDGYEYQTVLLRGKWNGEWSDCDDFCDEVIAWMPLPEPYKEGEEE